MANSLPRCSCERPSERRTGRRISTGASENKRLDSGRVIQRHVLYLGEINSTQAEAWRKAIEVFDENAGRPRTLALFPEDRCTLAEGGDVIRLRLSQMRLCRPRRRAGRRRVLWRSCRPLLGRSPAGKPLRNAQWNDVLRVLATYRLIARAANGAWIGSGLTGDDLLGADFGLAEANFAAWSVACRGVCF